MSRTILGLLGAVVLVCGGFAVGASDAMAQAPEAVKIRIPITDNGFNDQPSGFEITVEQGQLVELTFVWEHAAYLEEAHIFVLEGYNLESDEISFHNREATLRFVAEKPGAFRLKCDVDCEVHDVLKRATLNVVRPGMGGAAVPGGAGGEDARPAAQILIAAPVEAGLGTGARLLTTLTDESGTAIAGAKVSLFEVIGFMGVEPQEVEVATGMTDAQGTSTLVYTARRTGNRTLTAYFDGGLDYRPTSIDLQLTVPPGPQVYLVSSPVGIPGVNRFFVSGIILMVWGTMFVVALHVVAIARAGARSREDGDDVSS